MKIAELLIVEVLVCVYALCAWASGPKISFNYEVKDFGKVHSGEKLTERFRLTNVGDDVLIVREVRADCGCTKTLTGSPELIPGGHSEILAILETSDLGPGRKERHIYVKSNDPQRPSVKLTLRADVVRELTVDPSTLTMRIEGSMQSVSFDLRIANASDKPVTVTSVKALDRDAHAEMEGDRLVVGPGSTSPCRPPSASSRYSAWPC